MWMKKKNKEKQIIKWFILNRRNKKKNSKKYKKMVKQVSMKHEL